MPGIARPLIVAIVMAGSMLPVRAAEITVAVASNFARTAEVLAQEFEQSSGHQVRLVAGSSGKLFAQIVNGAPFDLFLSADVEQPRRLELEGYGVTGSRYTYALGQLVLWSREDTFRGKNCLRELENSGPVKLAMANPRLAPYGLAAKNFLESTGLWERLQHRLVYGENVAQALQFAASGGAGFALVAASQLSVPGLPVATCMHRVANDLYTPIRQQAVLLRRAENNLGALQFLEYLRSTVAQDLISSSGYGTGDGTS